MRQIKQGNSYLFEVIVLNYDGSPRDLSDVHDVKYVLADTVGSFTPHVSKDLSSPDVNISTEDLGIITIKLTNNDTKNLDVGTYYHEVTICDPIGNVNTVLAENVEIVDIFIVDC